jgi:GIY-YIG catalytic domain-containing protein
LRQRLRTHYAGNAEDSTLRKTLGYLLAGELDIQLRRVGSGTRKTFVEGKRALSAWMADNAFVSWVIRERPWNWRTT